MERNVTLEAEEWYVLANWLRERENRLQYALRSKSREWAFVHDLRRDIERQRAEEGREGEEGDRRRGAEDERRPSGRGESGTASTEMDVSPTETDGKATETRGTTRTVTLSDRQVSYLASFLRKRARRLLLRPWRDRERRDVRHLRDHLLDAAERADRGDEGLQG